MKTRCSGVTDDAVRPTELGYFFGDELSVRFYSPPVRRQLDALGMKYGMFFEQDRYA
jgi:oxygen-independent coproporphyrinogen III oxidase